MADERNRTRDSSEIGTPDRGRQGETRDMDEERVRGGSVEDVRGIADEDDEEFEETEDLEDGEEDEGEGSF